MRACSATQASRTTGASGAHSWSAEGRDGGHWNTLASGDRLIEIRNSTVRGRNVGMQMAPEWRQFGVRVQCGCSRTIGLDSSRYNGWKRFSNSWKRPSVTSSMWFLIYRHASVLIQEHVDKHTCRSPNTTLVALFCANDKWVGVMSLN